MCLTSSPGCSRKRFGEGFSAIGGSLAAHRDLMQSRCFRRRRAKTKITKSSISSFDPPTSTFYRNAAAKKKLADASVSPLSRRMGVSPLAPRSPNVNGENRAGSKEIKMGRGSSMSPSPSGHARGSPFIPRHEEVVSMHDVNTKYSKSLISNLKIF